MVAIAAGLMVAGLAVGCTPAPEDPEPTPSETPTESSAPPQVTDIIDPPGTGEGLVGALADTTLDRCEPSDAGWTVAGTVTNPTDAAASYRIYVSLLTADNDTRALAQVNVETPESGVAVDWGTDIAAEGDNLSCVLRVERYAAATDEGDEG